MDNQKIVAFKDVLYYLKKWYDEEHPNKSENDLSVLKVMKLLFFIVGVGKNSNLFDTFNNFQAWRYGHVESDIYEYYTRQKGDFKEFILDRKNLICGGNYQPSSSVAKEIKNNIAELKKENPEIISYNAYRLVDISHSYSSWNIYYNKLNDRHKAINLEILKNESRYYK